MTEKCGCGTQPEITDIALKLGYIPHLEVSCVAYLIYHNVSYILKQYSNDFTYIVTAPSIPEKKRTRYCLH